MAAASCASSTFDLPTILHSGHSAPFDRPASGPDHVFRDEAFTTRRSWTADISADTGRYGPPEKPPPEWLYILIN
jgi:hypothetical protein